MSSILLRAIPALFIYLLLDVDAFVELVESIPAPEVVTFCSRRGKTLFTLTYFISGLPLQLTGPPPYPIVTMVLKLLNHHNAYIFNSNYRLTNIDHMAWSPTLAICTSTPGGLIIGLCRPSSWRSGYYHTTFCYIYTNTLFMSLSIYLALR